MKIKLRLTTEKLILVGKYDIQIYILLKLSELSISETAKFQGS